ncbi:helix-turn-helix domain-containing protein [Ihubacter sp. rT4E-8]|uniref:helix-turn-helix domain-containing protein n=1 Tax=Ihubacter sp. rT4E-8 TaxID=3242369 RepID=UPI003CEB8B83
MYQYSKEVGNRIRTIRKSKGLSQQKFASALHKTKSTISKYERGAIALDLETLHEICQLLQIPPHVLLSTPEEAANTGAKTSVQRLYLYNLAGRSGILTRSLIEIYSQSGEASNLRHQDASIFYGLPSFQQPEKCQGFYYGSITKQDIFTHLHVVNQKNNIEQVSVCYRSNLDNLLFDVGLLTGLSFASLVPVSCKAVISEKPLPENETMLSALAFDQAELRRIRNTGIVALLRR